MELTCTCGEEMTQDNPGLDYTDVNFTIEYSCSCGVTAKVSFDADENVEFTDNKGNNSYVNIHEVIN